MRIKASKAFQQIQASRRDDLENFSIRMADLFHSVNGNVIEDIIAKGSDTDVEDAYRFMNSIYRQLTFLEDLHTEIFGSRVSSQNQNIKAARARAGVSRGTPEQMMTALNNKIAELSGGVIDSATQPGAGTPVTAAVGDDAVVNAVMNKLAAEGYDTSDPEVQNFASAALVKTVEEVDEWWQDTVRNYPEDLTTLPRAVESGQDIMSAEDAPDGQMVDTFAEAIEAEIGNEVESLAVVAKEDALVVTITYMGQVHEYNVPFEDIHLDLSDMEGDVAYIVNTIRQDLDNIDNNV